MGPEFENSEGVAGPVGGVYFRLPCVVRAAPKSLKDMHLGWLAGLTGRDSEVMISGSRETSWVELFDK